MKHILPACDTYPRSDQGIATVISVILLLGLIIAFTTTIHLSYIPAWKNDAEYSHMDDVHYDMSNLKSNIDILSAVMLTNPGSSVFVSLPVRMGGGDIPIVATGKSSGSLSLNTTYYGMVITGNDLIGPVYNSTNDLLDLGTIRYSSKNNYYIDQMYEYENGALLLVQQNRSLIKLSPAVVMQRTDGVNISLMVSAVELNGNSRIKSSNSIEEVYVQTNNSTTLFSGIGLLSDATITVYTDYPDAWVQYFNMSAKRADLVNGTDYTLSSGVTNVTFTLTGGPGEEIQLYVQKNSLDVRIDVI
ncbi:MAG: hypothetical protein SCH39_08435 [Methanosarcinales archaeon]|nr:hypothetical protein [ANME-2 cluster archaeon]MDW7776343.1 hypothetical protein [Methanosarcinales archaeon]